MLFPRTWPMGRVSFCNLPVNGCINARGQKPRAAKYCSDQGAPAFVRRVGIASLGRRSTISHVFRHSGQHADEVCVLDSVSLSAERRARPMPHCRTIRTRGKLVGIQVQQPFEPFFSRHCKPRIHALHLMARHEAVGRIPVALHNCDPAELCSDFGSPISAAIKKQVSPGYSQAMMISKVGRNQMLFAYEELELAQVSAACPISSGPSILNQVLFGPYLAALSVNLQVRR